MKILARYISSLFIKNYLLAVFGLTFLFLIQAIVGQIFEDRFGIDQILIYRLLETPQILVKMNPPAVLLATVLTLSGLSRTSELIACHSIGVGLRQIVTIVLSLVFMVSCFSLVLQDRIIPPLYKKRTTYYWREMRGKPDFTLDVRKAKIWYRSEDLIYNLRSFDPKTQTILGMVIYTFDRKFNLVQVVEANEAVYTERGWNLRDGTVTVFGADEGFPVTQKFETKDFKLRERPQDFQEIEKRVEGLRLKELWRYIAKMRESGIETIKSEVTLHSRISLSFIPLVMVLLATPFALRGRREGGLAMDLALCLGVTVLYLLFDSVGLSMGKAGDLPPMLAAWLPSLLFIGLAAGLLLQKRRAR